MNQIARRVAGLGATGVLLAAALALPGAQALDRPGLGTSWGEQVHAPISFAPFQRAAASPQASFKTITMLAGFYALIDLKGWRRWAFPLTVVGMNSIAVYVMSWTMSAFVGDALDRHLGSAIWMTAGATFQPVLHGFAVLLIFWLTLFWMYRRKIFLRI